MLAIRLQRFGRKGDAFYRIIVQEAQKNPTSGRVVAFLGHYNPKTKEVKIDTTKAQEYLDHGAQPSPRVASLLESQKVKLPIWVKKHKVASKTVKNPDKLRKNRQPETTEAQETEAEVKTEAEEPSQN